MVPALQVLILWGVIRSIGTTCGSVIVAKGRPDIITKLQLLTLSSLILIIYPLSIRWGILGTSIAVLLSTFTSNIIAFGTTARLIGESVWKLLNTLWIPLINTAVVMGILAKASQSLVVEIFLSLLAYLLMTYLATKLCRYTVFTNIRAGLKSLREGSSL